MSKSVRQEFIESVQNDDTMSLARRLVSIKRKLQREMRWGDAAAKCRHAEIIRQEITRRIKERN